MSQLYNMMACNMVIGCLYKNPSLYFDERFPLDLEDFHDPKNSRGYRFQRILFGTGYELAKKNVKEISAIEVGEFNTGLRENLSVLEENNYIEAIENFKDFADENSFEFYYNRIRILSLLANCKYEKGYNIDKFFNVDEEENKELSKLEQFTIKDIINYYELNTSDLRQKYLNNTEIEYYKAGKDFDLTIQAIKNHELMGSSFQSKLLNEIFNGQLGFILTAGKSGDGKSIIACGNMCNVSALKLWDENKQEFVDNVHFSGGSLFINTELSLREEVDIMCLAFISNVDRGKIRRWNLTEEEETRVLKAKDILVESPIYVCDDPQFTTKSLELEIKDHVLKYNVKHIFFDYVQNNGFVAKEISSETNVPTREDMVLLTLTSRCKDMQRKYGVFFASGVQTNTQIDTLPYPTEAVLAGGQSQVRKTDGTMVLKSLTKKEWDVFEKCYPKKRGFNVNLKPNRAIHIVKGRNTQYEKYCKILVRIEFGTGRIYDFMAMDKNDNPINIKELDIITNRKES